VHKRNENLQEHQDLTGALFLLPSNIDVGTLINYQVAEEILEGTYDPPDGVDNFTKQLL
jgi:hypothetical protein